MAKLHYQEAPSEGERKAFAKYLAEDEELILATSFGSAYLRSRLITAIIWPGIVPIIFGLGLAYFLKFNLGVGLLVGMVFSIFLAILKTIYLYHSNRYLLTTRRVMIKKGLITVKLTAALYDKITHIEVEQNFVDKLLMHHGTVIINTAGMNKGEITLSFIDYPIEFKNLLERMINREREQFGIRTGPVTAVEGEIVS